MRRRLPAHVAAVILLLALSPFAGIGACQLSTDLDGLPTADIVLPDSAGPGEDAGADTGGGADAGDGAVAPDAAGGEDTGGDVAGPPTTIPDAPFADPTAVVVGAAHVFVANDNRGPDGTPGLGFVTVVDRDTWTVVNRIATTQPAPRALALHGDTLIVVNRGLVAEDGGVPTPVGDGGVDLLRDVTTAATAAAFDENVPIAPDGLVGAPHSVALGADDRAFLGSATTGAIFSLDVPTGQLLRGVSDPIEVETLREPASLALRADGDGNLWIAERERSLVHLLDPDESAPTATYELEKQGATGPTQIVLDPGGAPDVFVLLPSSSQLAAIDSQTDAITPGWAGLGPAPAAIALDGGGVLVADAAEDALGRVDLAGGAAEPAYALLPDGAEPGAVAVVDATEGREAWVALPGRDAVAVVDVTRGWTLAILGGDALGDTCVAPPAPAGPLPDEVLASPQAALFAGGFVFVANANVGLDGTPGPGFVTVIDPDSLSVVNRIPTTQPAPGALAADGRWLYVVNAGTTTRDDGTALLVPDGPGGVDWIDLYTAATASAPAANVAIEPGVGGPPAGAPHGIVLPGDDESAPALIGSLVGPYAFTLDTALCATQRGSDDPIVLAPGVARNDVATPFDGPSGLVAVALREGDAVHLVNAADGAIDPGPWASPYDLSADGGGPVDGLRVDGGAPDIYALLGEAAAVATIDTGSDLVEPLWAPTAAGVTRLRERDGYLYVVNGASDAVRRVDRATGDGLATFLSVPTLSGPADIAFVELPRSDTRAFVPNVVAATVSVFRLADGASLGAIP